MRVRMLTYCRNEELLYGSLLSLQTLRIGFPSTEVEVYDNASIPVAREAIEAACREVGAQFAQIEDEVLHHDFLRYALTGPERIIVIDPDIAFWKSVEGFDVRGHIGGVYIPAFMDEYRGEWTAERLHTSFLWCNSTAALRGTDFAPRIENGVYYDTAAAWYRDTGLRISSAFTSEQRECFDHLFCGSHIDLVAPKLRDGRAMLEIHRQVKNGNIEALRGMWKIQDQHFLDRAKVPA